MNGHSSNQPTITENGSGHVGIVLGRLGRLVELEVELGVAEVRQLLKFLAITAGVAVVSLVLCLASLVVLLAGALAPVFDAPWKHLVIAGGAVFLLSAAGGIWSGLQLKRLQLPAKTLKSIEENARWLGAQLRSKLTLR